MNLLYEYITLEKEYDDYDEQYHEQYHGKFQCDKKDFLRFFKHLPRNVTYIFLELESGALFRWHNNQWKNVTPKRRN